MSDTGPSDIRVVVSVFSHYWNLLEIFRGRRRGRLPFETFRAPGIRSGNRAVANGPEQIDQRDQIADAENGSAGGRHHVEHLKFSGVDGVAARHAQVAENELREEREVEADENYQRGETRPAVRIHASRNFRPPEMNAAQISHYGAADHDVVKVRDDEISPVEVHVCRERRQEQSREAAHGEQPDKAEGIEHWRVVGNRTFIERRSPVENLHRRGNRDQEAEHRENQAGVNGLAGDEHVMAPHQKADDRDGQAGKGDKGVAENAFAREAGDQLTHHAHAGQNHDVHGGMRIEPEHVLEQDGIAADGWIEDADVQQALQAQQENGDGDYGRAEDKNDTGGVHRPDEKRQSEPGEAGRAHFVNGYDEIQAGENRGKASDEYAERRGDHAGVRKRAAVGRIERPAGIHAAGNYRIQREGRTDDVDVPAQKIQARKCQIA